MTEEHHNPQVEAAELLAAMSPEVQAIALATLRRLKDPEQYSGPFGWLLGVRYVDRSPGKMRCALLVDESLFNPAKVAHGGVVYSLIDSAMGASVYSLLESNQGCVTAELKVNYLRPIFAGEIIAAANVIQRGRTLAVVTAEVHDEQNRLVAIATGTFAILQSKG